MAGTALILIDVQDEYFDPESALRIPDGPAVLGRLEALLADARAHGLTVVHVRHTEEPGAEWFDPGGPRVGIREEVAPADGEPVIEKHLPGAFHDTGLEDLLEAAGIERVVIGGFMTHMCCDTTAREAAHRGYEVLFLSDGTATRDLDGPDGSTIGHGAVQAAILAAQADGFSTPADVASVQARVAAGEL